MKLEVRIVGVSVVLGILTGVTDSVVDYFMFYDESFWDLMIFEVPLFEVYVRSIILAVFIVAGVVVAHMAGKQKEVEQRVKEQNDFLRLVLDSLSHPFCVIDASDYRIKLANAAVGVEQNGEFPTCHAATHNSDTPCHSGEHPCPIEMVKKTKQPVVLEHVHHDREGEPRAVEVHAHPVLDQDGNVTQIIEYSVDITERKAAEEERTQLIAELQAALSEVKTLKGHLPICAHCNKIRDDQGYWSRLESYIHEHSGAEFTHGICPDCEKKYFNHSRGEMDSAPPAT